MSKQLKLRLDENKNQKKLNFANTLETGKVIYKNKNKKNEKEKNTTPRKAEF
jgi:hypothetical protein